MGMLFGKIAAMQMEAKSSQITRTADKEGGVHMVQNVSGKGITK